MIDHFGITVTDYARSRAWYEAALAPIGYRLLVEVESADRGDGDAAGFGEITTGRPDFWIAGESSLHPATKAPIHVAFRVRSRVLVNTFYVAALQAGGISNGAPGLRTHYHPSYYGAFVRDPDGHNIEAVCHISYT